MLERSMFRYSSELSLPSHKLPSSALVPEMICRRLLSSLVAFETASFETDFRAGRGVSPSEFTGAFCSNRDAVIIEIIVSIVCQYGAGGRPRCLEIRFAIHPDRRIFTTPPLYE